jgi:hypothetical protein
MLTLYTGLYENLTAAQQRAIHKLTVHRYVDDIYHLDAHLQQVEDLTPGTPEFERAYAAQYAQIHNALAESDDHTYVSAILLSDQAEEWIALAAMRTLLGKRADVTVAHSIGHADSSIPTHTLLQAFHYPSLSDFDPEVVTEAEIFEVSRLAAADHGIAEQLIRTGVMSQAELQAVLTSAFDELIVNSYRTGNAATHVAGWIFNVKPKLAAALKLRKGLNLIPLYSLGVEPTAQALNSALDKPYFHRWHAELFKLLPDTIVHEGMLAAVRYLAGRDIREWQDCELSLPYLLANNAELECAIEKLEAKLAQRSYELTREMAYA